MQEPAIRTRALTKCYGESRGVVDLDLEVSRGEVYGFLGPNGAGKTTTIRTLLDFIRPTSGSASVLGLDCRRDSLEVRRRVGYLPGELSLYDGLTGRELVSYLGGLRGDVDEARVAGLAGRLECELGRRIGELSHGNKQKLGLLVAFMGAPELLILDEPTSGLDPLMQRELYEWIAEAREGGATVFFSSHVLPEVERVCDRVGIVRDGRLVSVETVADVKAKSVRRVEIRFEREVPRADFEELPGVADLELEGARLRCTARGSLDPLIRAAARHGVVDLVSHEPDLEDVFLELYGDA